MATDKLHPAHALNRYLWNRIESAGILSKNNYSGLVPVIPVEEAPEFLTIIDAQPGVGSHPYIIYSWSRVGSGVQWFMKGHNVAYSIRSANDDKMSQLLNLFEREFQDYDKAAQRVNRFINGYVGEDGTQVPPGGSTAMRRFTFTHINVHVLGAPMPSESETGVSEALVTLSVNYTETTDSNAP